ncbi:MAG: FHA domain-containing serine/threonine-protein kinase [Acidobacteria bacterium]|nr:FHA domain-containing serine/threonine-protein kinase [Acidobacteriota bacterium]
MIWARNVPRVIESEALKTSLKGLSRLMAECIECGATIAAGESFCGGCGTQQPAVAEASASASLGQAPDHLTPAKVKVAEEEVDGQVNESVPEANRNTGQLSSEAEGANKEPAEAASPRRSADPRAISSSSLGGSATGGERIQNTTSVPHQGTTGGHQPTIKQLDGGTVLNGRYEIARRIGGGGMGAVYLAKDRNLGDASRAVKEMVEAHLDPNQHEKAIGDFKRESLLLTSLEHPSIPTIYDYFYDESLGRFYLVMKYISGGDLASRLRNAPGGRIDEKTVTDWGMQVADVLQYLHSRPKQIIYRDLKPANLMIDGNSGRVMLIDFGIARWVKQEEKGVTAVGTMGYAPPELFAGRVEPRSDVYSLGATMFHLLTGSDPQDNPLLIFDFAKNPRPRQMTPSLSSEIALRASRPTAKLVVAGTTELDASFILQKDNNLVGRTDPHSNIFPEIDLSKFDPETKVSRRHARIWLEGETFLVEDLGSVNGTVINDSVRLAPRQPRVLDSGDKLRLGGTTLHFLLG